MAPSFTDLLFQFAFHLWKCDDLILKTEKRLGSSPSNPISLRDRPRLLYSFYISRSILSFPQRMNECPGQGNLSCLQSVEPVLCLLVQLLWMSPSSQLLGLTEVCRRNNHTQLFSVWFTRGHAAVSLEVLLMLECFFIAHESLLN